MELVLDLQDTGAVTVTCDGAFSHSFPLSDLYPKADHTDFPQPLKNPNGFGDLLFATLFPPKSPARHGFDQKPERILLVTTDPLVQAIPWEFLHGPRGFLVCDTRFLRGLPKSERRPAPLPARDLTIHVVPANPLDPEISPVPADSEWEQLSMAVTGVAKEGMVQRVQPATLDQLRKLVAGKAQQIVHFIGHGAPSNAGTFLCFEHEDGGLHLVDPIQLKNRLGNSTFLLTLNSCASAAEGPKDLSNIALALVREGLPYVVGMQFVVSVQDAQIFSHNFYADLARGSTVEETVFQARMALQASGSPEAVGIPVLYTSLDAAVGGFDLPEGSFRFLEIEPNPRVDLEGIPEINGAFQGRSAEQITLGRQLTGPQRARLVTIRGEGGQGKTTLARVAAERFAWAWPGGVCAISLESLPDLPSVLLRLAEFLGLPDLQTLTPSQLERQVLHKLARQRTLLLLDNAETLIEAVEEKQAPALELVSLLRERLPATTSLLVTSRRPLGWPGEVAIELGGLAPQEGARLFAQCAPNRLGEMTMEAAQALSARLGGHALSLRILGATFNELDLSLAAFTQQVEQHLEGAVDKYRELDHRQRSLFASIDTSVVYLSKEQIEVLSALWLFQAPFLAEAAVAVLDPENAASSIPERLRALWQRGLLGRVEHTLANGTLVLYHLLPVLRVYARRALSQAWDEVELLSRFGAVYGSLIARIYQQISKSARFVYLARAAEVDLDSGLERYAAAQKGWYSLRWGYVLFRLGNPWKGRRLLEQALEAGQGGQDQELELQALNGMGILCAATGRPRQALEYYQQARPILREVGDRAGESTTLSNIGSVYWATGQPQRALDYFQQALPIQREVGDRAGEATTLNNIGLVYQDTGQQQPALDYLQQALPILREVGDRAGEAGALNNIGLVYQATGQPQPALDYYQQALPIVREVGDRAGEATTLNNIGGVYQTTGQPQRALDYYQQALPIHREVGNRAGEAGALNNIGLVYQATRQPQQALDYYQQALPILREVSNRAGEATTLNNIGGVYQTTGQPQQALDYYQQALPIVREVGDRAGEATTLNNIGGVYQTTGQPQRALDYYQQALPIVREVGDRAGEAMTLNNIGGVYQATGQPQQALDYYQQALTIMREVGDRAREAVTLTYIAIIHVDQQQLEQAVTLLEQVINIDTQIGAAHRQAGDLFLLAQVLDKRLGRGADAIPLVERSIRLMQDQHIERDDAGFTLGQHEQFLAELKGDAPPQSEASIPDDMLHTLQANTIAVLTSWPDKLEEWRAQVISLVEQADARRLPQEQAFFQALLALLNEQQPDLPHENPYHQVLQAILDGIRQGEPEAREEGDSGVLIPAINAFVSAGSVDEIQQALEGNPVLLDHPQVERIFETNIQQYGKEDEEFAQRLAFYLKLLRDVKANGIEMALQQLKNALESASAGDQPQPTPTIEGLPAGLVERAIAALTGSSTTRDALYAELQQVHPADAEADKLIQTITRSLSGDGLETLGANLSGAYAEIWRSIVEGVKANGSTN